MVDIKEVSKMCIGLKVLIGKWFLVVVVVVVVVLLLFLY